MYVCKLSPTCYQLTMSADKSNSFEISGILDSVVLKPVAKAQGDNSGSEESLLDDKHIALTQHSVDGVSQLIKLATVVVVSS